MSCEHAVDNRMVYLSSVRVSDAPEGMFARILRHDCSGERYHAPPKPEKPKRRSMAQNPKPFNDKGAAMAREICSPRRRITTDIEHTPPRRIVLLRRSDGTDRNSPRDFRSYDGRGASKALLLAIARVRNKGGERALALNKMAIDEDGLVEREQARELDATRFDEWGTPDRKLPNCPRCDEDELFADGLLGRFSCYRCGWTREQAREGMVVA